MSEVLNYTIWEYEIWSIKPQRIEIVTSVEHCLNILENTENSITYQYSNKIYYIDSVHIKPQSWTEMFE